MPDILYAAALDKQLYADSQLAVAQAQRSAADSRKSSCASLVTACATCLACCQCCVTVVKTPTAKTTEWCIQQCLNQCPMSFEAWSKIPLCGQLSAGTSNDWCTFWVCDPDYRRCGRCCNWTIPNVNSCVCVQFDMWSPGAYNSSGYCCGHAVWGANGSFGSIVACLPAGCQYTICGGCAICCYAGPDYQGYGHQGSCTKVVGYALCGVCVPSPTPHALKYFFWSQMFRGPATQCRSFNCADGSGQCFCGGMWQCADNSCATCGIIKASANDALPLGTLAGPAGGVKGHYYKVKGAGGGCYCKDSNNYGWYATIGVPRFPYIATGGGNTEETGYNCSAMCRSASSSTCSGCQWSGGIGGGNKPPIPGLGAGPVHVMGSCTNSYGDSGRMGAVRVSYKYQNY